MMKSTRYSIVNVEEDGGNYIIDIQSKKTGMCSDAVCFNRDELRVLYYMLDEIINKR